MFPVCYLDTFCLGCLGGVAIYSFPYRGFNGPLIFVSILSVHGVMQINIIISFTADPTHPPHEFSLNCGHIVFGAVYQLLPTKSN